MQNPTPKGHLAFNASKEGTAHESTTLTLIENGDKSIILYRSTSPTTGIITHLPLSQILFEPVANTQGLIRVIVPQWLHDLKKNFFAGLCSN
jgi:hypothetical protein